MIDAFTYTDNLHLPFVSSLFISAYFVGTYFPVIYFQDIKEKQQRGKTKGQMHVYT